MAVAPDTGMEKAEMKRFMGMAVKEPINCAVGVAAEPGVGLLMLHKTKSPKALEKDLSTKFPTAKATRWGTVAIADDGLVRFTINKAVSGLAPRLIKTLKGTGHSKIEIVLEDGSLLEGAAGEQAEGDTQEATGQTSPDADKQAETEKSTEDATGPDLGELQKKLGGLIKQIGAAAGSDAGRGGELKALAVEANNALKAGDGKAAETAIGKLESALAGGGSAPEQKAPVGTAGIVAMQKSRLLWDSARKRVASEISELKKRAGAEFEGDPEEAMVRDALDQLDEITSELDDRLLDALDDALSEQDPEKHADALQQAKDVLADYAKFVQSNELVQKLNGDTPFGMSLSIGTTMAATLKALQASLR